jgi:hypothetical protein
MSILEEFGSLVAVPSHKVQSARQVSILPLLCH